MRKIRKVEIGGIVVGLAMLDDIIDEVKEMDMSEGNEIGDELMKRIKIYNYVPQKAEAAYRAALIREYNNTVRP